jgi:hypothetical protein
VNPAMSHGCRRCCKYGSKEQQQAKAKWLALLVDQADEFSRFLDEILFRKETD